MCDFFDVMQKLVPKNLDHIGLAVLLIVKGYLTVSIECDVFKLPVLHYFVTRVILCILWF